jgi:hypothetical protein
MEERPHVADELQRMKHEPLLPIERRLIAWSLIVGVVLLVVLVTISRIFIKGV